ncbi:hypothetical protein GGR57DRAFT_260172 [Xylariaceae sp. FL1272]|nr:hypothetical protein GGR57DRAFT_260172 [Xylariaceae sp. FL1272]
MPAKLSLYKLVILGDGGVGKTCMTIQLTLQHFVETYDPTIEDSYRKQVVIDDRPCMIEILDTAGQEEYIALRDQWIRDGEGFILAYSICSRASFSRILRFHRQVQRVKESALSAPSYPGSPMTQTIPNIREVPMVIVGNKADRVTEREVSTEEGHALARELGVQFLEVSAKSSYNVEKAFYDIVRHLRRQREAIPLQQSANRSTQSVASHTSYRTVRTFWGSRRILIPPSEMSTEAGRSKLAAALVSAAKANDERLVLAYLEAGVDVNVHSGTDGSALHASAAAGHANIVNILLKKGVALSARGPTGTPALHLAAAEGHLAIVRLLIHKGAKIDQTGVLHGTALSAAASRGRADIVRFLLKKGASVSITGGPYGNALLAASWNGNPDVIKYLLDAGADVRARGDVECTALQMASFVGKASAVQILLDRGARVDINASQGRYGSALKAATEGNHYEVVTLLLEAGATPLPLNIEGTDKSEDATKSAGCGSPIAAANTTSDTAAVEAPLATEPVTLTSPVRDETIPITRLVSEPPPISGVANNVPPTYHRRGISANSTIKIDRKVISAIGITTIHDSPIAAVDVVFVHGLQGHPERTWKVEKSQKISLRRRLFGPPSAPVDEDTAATYWPYDLLAQSDDFRDSRIMTWGYDTRVIREFFGGSDQQNISQHGNNLLVNLQQERKEDPLRPLIFVAHSLGGIVLKVALDNSKRSTHQPQYLGIYKSTSGIVFLGTPHGGSQSANWGLLVSKIVKSAMQAPAERVLRGLTPNSELLENLRKAFLQMLEDGHFGIHSFYETRPIVGMYGLNSLVVPFESSLVGHASKEVSAGLFGNHSEICKFAGPDDPSYRLVFGALQDYVRQATGNRHVAVHVTKTEAGPPQLELSNAHSMEFGQFKLGLSAEQISQPHEEEVAA